MTAAERPEPRGNRLRRRDMLLGGAVLATGCLGRRRTLQRATGARIRVLGTAQDGGVPHAACSCARCDRARRLPSSVRHVASLALATGAGRVALIDATPDIGAQLDAIADLRQARPSAPRATASTVDRRPVDALFITHAHIGHYTGLAELGFEAVDARGIPAHVTEPLAQFFRDNAPWDQLVSKGNIELVVAPPGRAVELDDLSVTPVSVPHRNEYADTVGYRIAGPRRTVLYVPDCKPWSQWAEPPDRLLHGVDLALLDGTFYSMNELPGRDIGETGHPLMTETMERFASQRAEGLQIRFTHLNHSNPALTPGSPAHAQLRRHGFDVLREGADLPL